MSPPLAQPSETDHQFLAMLDSTFVCLKHQQLDVEALGCLEQSLWLKRRMFGVESLAVSTTLRDVILGYNALAMKYLAHDAVMDSVTVLRKAEAILAPGNFVRCHALQILTFNNLGCGYRKIGKLSSALKYLKEAARVGAGAVHVKNLSITHLNLCAIYSQLHRHELALEHAQCAIFYAQEELVRLDEEERENPDATEICTREEKMIALAVAYHNLGVELEFNQRRDASLQWYKKALELVWKYRDTNRGLYASLRRIFQAAKRQQESATSAQNPINRRPKSAHAGAKDGTPRDVSYSSTVASQCYKSTGFATAAARRKNLSLGAQKRPLSAKATPLVSKRTVGQPLVENPLELHWEKLEQEHGLTEKAPTMKKRRPQSASAVKRRLPLHKVQQERKESLFLSANETDFFMHETDCIDALSDGEDVDNSRLRFENNDHEKERTRECLEKRPRSASGSRQSNGRRRCLKKSESFSRSTFREKEEKDLDLPSQRVRHLEYLRRMKELAESIKEDLTGVDTTSKNPTRLDEEVGGLSGVERNPKRMSKLRDKIQQSRRDQVETERQLLDVQCKTEDDSYREASVRRLQAFVRGQRGRAEGKRRKQIKTESKSAMLLQRQVRRYLTKQRDAQRRRTEEIQVELQRLEVEDMAACLIQRLWRRACRRNELKANDYEYPNKADISVPLSLNVDSSVPSHRAGDDQQEAAIRIQALLKRFIVQSRQALANAQSLSRMYIERQHYSVTLTHTMALEADFLQYFSALKIQSLVRGHQSRLLSECLNAHVAAAASILQRAYRGYRTHRLQLEAEGIRRLAAHTIQHSFRDYLARKAARHQTALTEEVIRVYEIAAQSIQKIWKQHMLALNHQVEEMEAATCIQAVGRGHLVRKSLKLQRLAACALTSIPED